MNAKQRQWHRTDSGKQLAGVCAGVAETYGVSPTTVRLLYVLASLCGVPMVVVYLIQWLTYPKQNAGEAADVMY
ncbi:PspC domain-containing protein [Corynebacterium camporealensis]